MSIFMNQICETYIFVAQTPLSIACLHPLNKETQVRLCSSGGVGRCPRVLGNSGPGPQLVMSYAHAMAAALVIVVNYDQGAGAALLTIVLGKYSKFAKRHKGKNGNITKFVS